MVRLGVVSQTMITLDSIFTHIRSFFHKDRAALVRVCQLDDGRIGFYNHDGSAFVTVYASYDEAVREILSPSPHIEEDKMILMGP